DERAVGEQRLRERHVLRVTLRLRDDQQHRMIGGEVVAARRVDVKPAARRDELVEKNRREVERVVADQLLERERLRRLQQRGVALYRLADAFVGEFLSDLIDLLRRQEQQRARKNDLDEVERVGDAVLHVFDARVFAIALCDRLDERIVRVDVDAFRQL